MHWKEINILREIVTPSWLYLQDYKRMHGQQNVKNIKFIHA
jgi:hypothetical protein